MARNRPTVFGALPGHSVTIKLVLSTRCRALQEVVLFVLVPRLTGLLARLRRAVTGSSKHPGVVVEKIDDVLVARVVVGMLEHGGALTRARKRDRERLPDHRRRSVISNSRSAR